MQLGKASLIKTLSSDPKEIKICLGENDVNSYQVLEIQIQPILSGPSPFG